MILDGKQYNNIVWKRIVYLMRRRRVTVADVARNSSYTYRGFISSKANRSLPNAERLLSLSDLFGCTVDDIIDPRIPMDTVEIEPIRHIPIGKEDKYSDETCALFLKECMKDTERIYRGENLPLPR